MKKLLFSIVPIIFLNSCGKTPILIFQRVKNNSIKFNSVEKAPSMLVDINCAAALPGNNDWNEKYIVKF